MSDRLERAKVDKLKIMKIGYEDWVIDAPIVGSFKVPEDWKREGPANLVEVPANIAEIAWDRELDEFYFLIGTNTKESK